MFVGASLRVSVQGSFTFSASAEHLLLHHRVDRVLKSADKHFGKLSLVHLGLLDLHLLLLQLIRPFHKLEFPLQFFDLLPLSLNVVLKELLD